LSEILHLEKSWNQDKRLTMEIPRQLTRGAVKRGSQGGSYFLDFQVEESAKGGTFRAKPKELRFYAPDKVVVGGTREDG